MGRKYDYCLFRYVHDDCFALQADGRCFCLDDAEFKDRETCPFYKLPSEVDPRVANRVKKINQEIKKKRKVLR